MTRTAKPKHERQLTKLGVAVWWIGEWEYGGYTEVKNMAEAYEQCEHLKKLGYGKPGKSEIHIIETRKRLWRFKP